MERRDGLQIGLAIVAAAAVGFVIALLAFNNNDNSNNVAATSTTSTTAATTATTGTDGQTTSATTVTNTVPSDTAPNTQPPDAGSCIALWDQANNRGAQTFLVNVASQQPVRVHVGLTTDTPPKCLVTVVGNNGAAYVFPEAGGTTYPYAQAAGRTDAGTLPPAQKTANALEQRDGTLKAR